MRARTIVMAAAVAGVTLLPSAASAAPSPADKGKKFELAKAGDIVAGGSAVKIKFTYTCPDGWEGGAGVTLVEALGDAFASGYGSKALKCTGKKQESTFFLQANTYDGAKPFRGGDASVVATLDAWNPADMGCPYGPCPVDDAPPPATAVAPGGGGKMSDPVERESVAKAPTSLHREFTGVVKLG